MQYKVQWYALSTAACCAIATCIRLGHVHAAVTTPITTNAAVCALAVRGDLIRILNKLLKRKSKFDAIMIETTGLANPAPVIQVSNRSSNRRRSSSSSSRHYDDSLKAAF
jgi:hypothetical protein